MKYLLEIIWFVFRFLVSIFGVLLIATSVNDPRISPKMFVLILFIFGIFLFKFVFTRKDN